MKKLKNTINGKNDCYYMNCSCGQNVSIPVYVDRFYASNHIHWCRSCGTLMFGSHDDHAEIKPELMENING
jgi:hypothetical protein